MVWTFRVFLLGSLSCVFLIIINKFYLQETAESVMSMVTTMAVAYPIAVVLAKRLPKRRIYVRAFDFEFALNPGPFSMREYVLISTLGNVGAVYGGLTSYSIPHSLSF
nr:oligopeptide transporter 2-like [Ipomoea batatas]GMC55117.1 oligopeptide transporter 2-like [Ipomoea batatas]GME14685.1 oligopeptide transporter 2-like [Ipomoea batatas]